MDMRNLGQSIGSNQAKHYHKGNGVYINYLCESYREFWEPSETYRKFKRCRKERAT